MTLYRDHLSVGVNSGTSGDQIDAVLVQFDCDGRMQMLASRSCDIPDELKDKIFGLMFGQSDSLQEMIYLDKMLAHLHVELINLLMDHAGYRLADIAYVGLHGQTILHQPGARPAYTLQIVDASVVYAKLLCPVVADFRSADVAASGQGAPLTPVFHRYLLNQNDHVRGVFINLGGILCCDMCFNFWYTFKLIL